MWTVRGSKADLKDIKLLKQQSNSFSLCLYDDLNVKAYFSLLL